MDEFMKLAIEEAKTGLLEGGIPIGSVLIKDGKIIGKNLKGEELEKKLTTLLIR